VKGGGRARQASPFAGSFFLSRCCPAIIAVLDADTIRYKSASFRI
jgi:hypothetical protein